MKIKVITIISILFYSTIDVYGQSKKEIIESLNYSLDSLDVILQQERANFESYKLLSKQKISDLESKNLKINQQLLDKSNQLEKKEKELFDFMKIHKDCDKSNPSEFIENYKFLDVQSGTYNPDGEFWIGNAMEEEVFPDGYFNQFDQLNIIPDSFEESDNDPNEINEEMASIVEKNFIINSPYNTFSGTIKVFYDRVKNILASKYKVKEGLPIGNVKFYSPSGELLVERVFDNNGKYLRSIKEPYSTNWKFDFENSNLIIYDFDNAVKNESIITNINIMNSVNEGLEDDNSSYYIFNIIDKSVFAKTFKVNGQKFTGKLIGHHFNSSSGSKAYEVSIKNGLLNGNVITFYENGDTSLYEQFSQGKLIKTIIEGEDGVAKPIIYLYPKKEMDVTVQLNFDGKLTHTYPAYNDGWIVHAKPSGQLFDKDSVEYYALYWEGLNNHEFKMNDGFIVPGNESAKFLNDVLKKLGLNRREANEFIVYWLPKLESSPFNFIHFSFDDYEGMAKLKIEPKPDEIIRVMMVYQPLNNKISIKEQILPNKIFSRNGFTVVEWGGSEINNSRFKIAKFK